MSRHNGSSNRKKRDAKREQSGTSHRRHVRACLEAGTSREGSRVTDDRAEVARLLVALADDHPSLGVLRRAARFVLEPAPEPAFRPGRCRGCGALLPSPGPAWWTSSLLVCGCRVPTRPQNPRETHTAYDSKTGGP